MRLPICSMWGCLNRATAGFVWDYAIANDTVIVTKDEDFAIRASVSKTSPLIGWIRIGNCSNARLLAWFEEEMPSVIAALGSGNRLVEITG